MKFVFTSQKKKKISLEDFEIFSFFYKSDWYISYKKYSADEAMTDSVFHSIDKSEYGMKSLARSVILLLNKTACLKTLNQSNFFRMNDPEIHQMWYTNNSYFHRLHFSEELMRLKNEINPFRIYDRDFVEFCFS